MKPLNPTIVSSFTSRPCIVCNPHTTLVLSTSVNSTALPMSAVSSDASAKATSPFWQQTNLESALLDEIKGKVFVVTLLVEIP